MISAQSLENVLGWQAGAGVGESFVYALAHPLVEDGFFPIERADGCANDLAGRGVSAGLDPGFDPFLKIAKCYGDGAACTRHGPAASFKDLV
jgi:hypothetical protein